MTTFTHCRTYYLRAETPVEAESWMSALRHTQVSGIPLSEQQLTSTGIPILIHKCLQFVESYGMETEGLYRLSGEKAKIRKLILAFNQGERESRNGKRGRGERKGEGGGREER